MVISEVGGDHPDEISKIRRPGLPARQQFTAGQVRDLQAQSFCRGDTGGEIGLVRPDQHIPGEGLRSIKKPGDRIGEDDEKSYHKEGAYDHAQPRDFFALPEFFR